MSFLLAPENIPFAVSLGVMLGIAVLEGALVVIGAGMSGFLDNLLPDLDVDAPDVDGPGDPGLPGTSLVSDLLGWLMIGKVPAMVLLVAFLTCFGLAGYLVQSVFSGITGVLLPGWVASAGALFLAFPGTRLVGKGVAKVVPADETSAVSSEEFIGLVATITLGTAALGHPAQGRLRDRHGQTHYVMIEPDLENGRFGQGDEVLIVRRDGPRFRAIANPNRSLSDGPIP